MKAMLFTRTLLAMLELLRYHSAATLPNSTIHSKQLAKRMVKEIQTTIDHNIHQTTGYQVKTSSLNQLNLDKNLENGKVSKQDHQDKSSPSSSTSRSAVNYDRKPAVKEALQKDHKKGKASADEVSKVTGGKIQEPAETVSSGTITHQNLTGAQNKDKIEEYLAEIQLPEESGNTEKPPTKDLSEKPIYEDVRGSFKEACHLLGQYVKLKVKVTVGRPIHRTSRFFKKKIDTLKAENKTLK
ncbi:hypothetical protein PGT21_031297 [Puccinia graminis f. sp. tritici]|uniref:Uncharacterized protein n=1 Tax=Puccinia graminis f. sp. tritici TaxID=56615 RepID=A0A5B0QC17_PUCGR|nr:hypothetical protein PGT21_031297 [Puccinia graminis f. sp. tritici]